MTRAGTVVDSSVLLDVFTEDRRWLQWSEEQLIAAAQRGALILNAVVVAEIAPRFSRIEALRGALPSMADFLIGAHAAVTNRPLLTRDPRRVAAYIPGAKLISP